MIPDNARRGKSFELVTMQLRDHRDDGVTINHPHRCGVIEHLVDVGATATQILGHLAIGDALLAHPTADRLDLGPGYESLSHPNFTGLSGSSSSPTRRY